MASTWRSTRSWHDWLTTGGSTLMVSISAMLSVAFCIVVFFAILASDAGMSVVNAKLGKIVGPHFGKFLLVTILLESAAIISLAKEAGRSGFRIRSRSDWIVSAFCTMIASVATAALTVLYGMVATSYAQRMPTI